MDARSEGNSTLEEGYLKMHSIRCIGLYILKIELDLHTSSSAYTPHDTRPYISPWGVCMLLFTICCILYFT